MARSAAKEKRMPDTALPVGKVDENRGGAIMAVPVNLR